MRSIPAREIKRRGIGAVDEQLKKGPVYVIRNDEPSYVVMSREQFEQLVDEYEESLTEQLRASMEDYEAGRWRYVTAEELSKELDEELE